MYTTPRKVKQESRLRRSLSLTNTSRTNAEDNSSGTTGELELDAHLTGTVCPPAALEERFLSSTTTTSTTTDSFYNQPNHLSAASSSSSSAVVEDSTVFSHQPPPYRAPPSALGGSNTELHNNFDGDCNFDSTFYNLPQVQFQQQQQQQSSPESNQTYQTHSAKFPIVKEVIFSASSSTTQVQQQRPNLNKGIIGFHQLDQQHHQQSNNSSSSSRIPISTDVINNKKLFSKPGLGWAEDRKAFTLDSRSAKEFQDKYQPGSQSQSQRITSSGTTRRNSLDLEKFIQVFNEEQALLASMQGRHLDGGIDNPALDLGIGSNSLHQQQQQHHSHHLQQQQLNYHSTNNNHSNSMYNGGIGVSSSKLSGYFPDSSNSTSTSSQSQSLSSSNTDSLDTVIYKGPSTQQGAGSIRDWQQRSSESNPEIPMDFNHRSENNNSHRDVNNHVSADARAAYQMQQQLPYQHSPQYNGQNYNMDYRSSQPQQFIQQQQGLSVQSHQQHSAHPMNGASNHQNNNGINNGLPMSGGMNMMRGGGGGMNGGTINPSYHGSNPQLASKSPLLSQKQFPTNVTPTDVVMSLDKTKDSTKQFPNKTYNHIKDMISSRFGTVGSVNNTNTNNNQMSYNNNSIPLSNNNGVSSSNLNGQVNNSIYPNHNGGGGMDMSLGLPNSSYGIHHHQNNTMSNFMSNGNGNSASYYNGQTSSQPQQSPNTISQNNSYRNDSSAVNDRKNINTSFRKAIQKSTQKSNLTEDSIQMRTIMEVQAQNQANNINNNQLHRAHQQPLQQYSPVEHQQSSGNSTGIHAARAQKALDSLLEPSKQYNLNPTGSVYSAPHLVNGDSSNSASSVNHVKQISQAQIPPPYQDKAPPPVPPTSSRMTDFSIKPPVGGTSPVKNPSASNYSKHAAESLPQAWNHNMLENDHPPPLPMSQKPSLQDNTMTTPPLGLPSPMVSSVRENGDGSSGSTEATPSSEAILKSEKLKQMSTELHNLALSVASEHHSSSSEGEIKGSQRVGSGQSHTTTDSGHGTVLLTKSPQHSGNTSEHAPLDGLIGHRHKFSDNIADSISSGNDSEWVDIVEPEIRQILELERAAKATTGKSNTRNPGSSSISQSHQSQLLLAPIQPNPSGITSGDTNKASPIPHFSRHHVIPSSPSHSPKLSKKFDLNMYSKKASQELLAEPSSGQDPSTSKTKSSRVPTSLLRSNSGSGQRSHPWNTRPRIGNDKGKSSTVGRKDILLSQTKAGKLTRNAMSQILYSLHNDDNGDMTSTTTGLDIESMLDGPTENTSDDDDLSTTIDTTDAHAIRRQLESLESMYTEVLKVLGAKKFAAGGGPRYPSSDLRNAKRRPYGSMSSLPSSVSSRPFRENKKKIDDKKKVKDIKSINRRFQRLESHVVTLARSVAHLSSEMRTQHLMVQEMEAIRNELSQLRSQVMKAQNQSATAVAAANGQHFARGMSGGRQGGHLINSTDWTSFRNALPSLTNPCRVRKLTKFFGDEPPLIRIFLKKLGYEKYATQFEQERIGIMELPYLTEERLQKMGVPMGPRLRILQEAHLCLKPGSHFPPDHPIHNGHGNGNLSVYVV